MKRSKRFTILAAALTLAGLCAGAALAAGGDEKDPLVTLSYLNEKVIPQVVAQVEQSAAARQEELARQFQAQVDQYRKDAQQGGGSAGSASYALVTLTNGQTLKPEVGCELLLRVGTVTVTAGSDPALIDLTTGGTINRNASLEKNHLYMATIDDRTLQATADSVKILVRGNYTIA